MDRRIVAWIWAAVETMAFLTMPTWRFTAGEQNPDFQNPLAFRDGGGSEYGSHAGELSFLFRGRETKNPKSLLSAVGHGRATTRYVFNGLNVLQGWMDGWLHPTPTKKNVVLPQTTWVTWPAADGLRADACLGHEHELIAEFKQPVLASVRRRASVRHDNYLLLCL
ncbi:hypothetical protein B0T20DRAFT_190000 [Sordaria brevicollis]|uniref:Uncharacterized protein n=1 Tax=Sordaria brevicollis TaxID=83679 RepID=A0AAE0UCH4_SORBR|nr:hypothetical protein B0T20DRAFT_190000 [Sordaria brevicollis]